MWLASAPLCPSPQPPLSPLPTSSFSSYSSQCSSTTQLATLVATPRPAKLPTAGGHFTLPSTWTRQIVIRGPGIPGRATVVRPQRRLPSPLDLPPWIMINGVLLFLALAARPPRYPNANKDAYTPPRFRSRRPLVPARGPRSRARRRGRFMSSRHVFRWIETPSPFTFSENQTPRRRRSP